MIQRIEWFLIVVIAVVSCALVLRTAPGREPFLASDSVPASNSIQRVAEQGASALGHDVRGFARVVRAERARVLRLAFEAGLVEMSWQLRHPSGFLVDFLGSGREHYTATVDLNGQLVELRSRPREAASGAVFEGNPAEQELSRSIAVEAYAAFWNRRLVRGVNTDFGFRLTADGVPERDGYLFEWTSQPDPSGRLAWKLSYLVRGGSILQFSIAPIALEPLLAREREMESTFEVLIVGVGVIGIIGMLYAAAVMILSLYRARLPWSFVARVMILLGAILVLDSIAGSRYANFRVALHSNLPSIFSQWIGAILVLMLAVSVVAAGRATRVSADFRRWLGLEEFLRFRWSKASVTRSFLAAFLVSPLWLGISYSILALSEGSFAESVTLHAVAIQLPPMAGIYAARSLAVLIVVTFAIPLVRAHVRNRNAQALLCVLVASVGCVLAAIVEFPVSALLVESVLHGTLLVYAYRRFGALAAVLGGILSEPLARAFVFFERGELPIQLWGVAMLVGGALFFSVVLLLDVRNPNRAEEQRLSEEEFEALKRESERRLVTRRERLLGEFALAQQAQQRMLPDHPPSLPGFEISSICVPAQQVGGDLYDYIKISDSRWALCVADVSGKGVSAALYMTMVKGMLTAAAVERADLLAMVITLNEHIYRVIEKRSFVTMMLAALDPVTRKLEVLRAGHPPMLHVRAEGSVEFLASNGMGLGLAPSGIFCRRLNTAQVRLAPGDVAVLYSDGVNEAMNRDREEFGEDRLARVVSSAVGETAESIRDRILASILEFQAGVPVHDDITIMVLRCLHVSANQTAEV
ncbi:MAG: PP2C family protein-serine/threonine phosphatase [Bryobacterales bacterium]|nr:PP2C family protein-serine/threonine phosphatase [Bryobacterales bacterium]